MTKTNMAVTDTAANPGLCTLIERTKQALADGACESAMAELEDAIVAAIKDKDLLTPAQKEGGDKCYHRHILHADKETPFTILSLVWRPGQASPIHGHRAWCAVGIAEGCLRVETFLPCPDGTLDKDGEIECRAGATCIEKPDESDVHRLSNCGNDTAVSIHIYGFDLSNDPAQINEVFDDSLWLGGGI